MKKREPIHLKSEKGREEKEKVYLKYMNLYKEKNFKKFRLVLFSLISQTLSFILVIVYAY